MLPSLFLLFILVFTTHPLYPADPIVLNTKWISEKPEVLTYTSRSPQGNGLYQVTVQKSGSTMVSYINIITTGFTKSVFGTMQPDMHPINSESRIFIDGQIAMETNCRYGTDSLHIRTTMKPYNRVMENSCPLSGLVIDFSQTPLLPRTLSFSAGARYSFQSINPQTNQLEPITMQVLGEEKLMNIDCFRVEAHDFEGTTIFWIEKRDTHRIIKFEQPATGRITELQL